MKKIRPVTLVVFAIAVGLFLADMPVSSAGKALDGKWQMTLSIAVAPGSKEKHNVVLNVDASPRGDSIHGRLTITDERDRTVGGVWRQVGKRVSITFEFPCSEGELCASLVMIGKIKGENFERIKNGTVVVMWDTPSEENYAMYDTSNGTFTGTRTE